MSEFEDHTDDVIATVQQARAAALREAGEMVLELSNAISPTELGDLDDTGTVVVDGDEATIGYDSEYAAKQHEMTYYKHPNGDQPKFLERAVTLHVDEITDRMASVMQRALRQ
ncbi:MAG: hypothetical protein INR72_18075 [Williamsia herbipolensis]|nr:hypothetical protein [Williamsia herbipolensis]